MRIIFILFLTLVFLTGCSSPVRFIQTDDSFVKSPKPEGAEIVFRIDRIERPHQVIGVIETELGRSARHPELDALLIRKARDIGADGLMLVQYDIDRDVYLETNHAVVGRGPWRHHVVHTHPRTEVRKTATAIAVIFK